MTTAVKVEGTCHARFEAVKEAFAQNFADFGEVGAAVAVMLDGRMVVDLWAGHADAALTRPWERDTIANVFSTTKVITADCAHRLADPGSSTATPGRQILAGVRAGRQRRDFSPLFAQPWRQPSRLRQVLPPGRRITGRR